MPAARAECPHCGQAIFNPSPGPANKIRCGACGESFELKPLIIASQENSASRPAETAPQPKPAEPPREKEPAPASYGLLTAASWSVVAYSLIFGTWLCYSMFVSDALNRIMLSSPASDPVVASLVTAFRLVQQVLIALCLLVAVRLITKTDRCASIFCWRSGALKQPLGEVPGSSLPFILPPAAVGGVLLICGLLVATGERVFESGSSVGAVFLAATGAVIFMLGLGCGELRRYFWRMGEFGRALFAEKAAMRADEYIADLLARHIILSSRSILFTSSLALLWVACTAMGESLSFRGEDVAIIALGLGATLACLYTFIRLEGQWHALLFWWRPPQAVPRPRWNTTRFLSLLTWLTVPALVIGPPFSRYRGNWAGPTGIAVLLLWLSAVKREMLQLRDGTAALVQSATGKRNQTTPQHLVLLLLSVSIILGGLSAFQAYVLMTNPGFMPTGLTMVRLLFWYLVEMLAAAGSAALPGIFVALILRDLNNAADNLRVCAEATSE